MEDNSLSDEKRDTILCDAFLSGMIKGGPDMLEKTRSWIELNYPDSIYSFKLLWDIKF